MSCSNDICKIVNCHTFKLNELENEVNKNTNDISNIFSDVCPVIIGENASGPDTSVVLGCDAIGSEESVVVGNCATSGGNSKNVVSGFMANAPETCSVAIGHMAETKKTGGIAIGKDAVTAEINGIAIGKDAVTAEINGIAIGKEVESNGINSVAIGEGSFANSDNSIVINASSGSLKTMETGAFYVDPIRNLGSTGPTGFQLLAYDPSKSEIIRLNKEDANGIPDGTCFSDYLYWDNVEWKTGGDNVHLGCGATSLNDSVAIGKNTTATGTNSLAIGYSANALGAGSVALGDRSTVTSGSNYGLALGNRAGVGATGTIVLSGNASGLTGSNSNAFYVRQIRGATGGETGLVNVCYNPTTYEVVHQPKIDYFTATSIYTTTDFKTNSLVGLYNYYKEPEGGLQSNYDNGFFTATMPGIYHIIAKSTYIKIDANANSSLNFRLFKNNDQIQSSVITSQSNTLDTRDLILNTITFLNVGETISVRNDDNPSYQLFDKQYFSIVKLG